MHNIVTNGLAGFVLPDRVALGDVNAEGTLHVSEKMTSHVLSRGTQLSDSSPHVTVRCQTLDAWVQQHTIDLNDVSFVKCDAQGSEGYILRGAAEVLRHKHIAWQLEFWPKGLRKVGFAPDEFYDVVRANFTHFLELSAGVRKPTTELKSDLADVGTDARGAADLLVYNAA